MGAAISPPPIVLCSSEEGYVGSNSLCPAEGKIRLMHISGHGSLSWSSSVLTRRSARFIARGDFSVIDDVHKRRGFMENIVIIHISNCVGVVAKLIKVLVKWPSHLRR